MSLIKPLKLGKQNFAVNLIQGPLAGVSCAPFRVLTSRYSQPAFTCTEMISCKTLINQAEYSKHRFVAIDPEEGPVCFQLSGNDPSELREAVRRVTDYGAALIDLNCGCPVRKIRSKGAGSSLLVDPSRLYQLIVAMKQNTHLPVSIKIRVEGESSEKFNAEIVKVVKDAGLDYLIVHGRHWTEHYETPCRHDQIRYFVEELAIPVIGNGDIACAQSLQRMLATGCAGAMIGRAGVGQPWLIKQLVAELNQQPFILPTQVEVGNMFLEHVDRLTQLLQSEKFAIIQARKFAKYYGRRLSDRAGFMEKINQCDTRIELTALIADYFKV